MFGFLLNKNKKIESQIKSTEDLFIESYLRQLKYMPIDNFSIVMCDDLILKLRMKDNKDTIDIWFENDSPKMGYIKILSNEIINCDKPIMFHDSISIKNYLKEFLGIIYERIPTLNKEQRILKRLRSSMP